MGLLPKKYDYIIPANGISSVEKVTLGGLDQTILIQAEDPTKPVLLMIHGGPTMPLPGVSCKGRDYTILTNTRQLVKHFVLVFWDQRGTGKSYADDIPQDTMTIAQFVADADELTDYLRQRFKQEKIFLAGHSWGSTIGLNLAMKAPGKFHSYVGFSQIVSWTENDKLALAWLKEEAVRRHNAKAQQELDAIGEPPYVDSIKQWGTLRKWQRKFNSLIYTDKTIKHPGLFGVILPMLQSEDYSLKDVFNSFYKGFKLIYTQRLIEELATINFMDRVEEIHIPVILIHGRRDYHVNGSLAEALFQRLDPERGNRFIWVEKSAHLFHPDDTRVIEQCLIEELRQLDAYVK
jgi:pimeloyl-ACP methyl ester carboxylesterase